MTISVGDTIPSMKLMMATADGPKEGGRLAEEMDISQPNVSQHLAVMRTAGIVEAERDGREVRYQLTDPDVILACGTMRRVLMRRLARLGELSERPAGADADPRADAAPRADDPKVRIAAASVRAS